MPEEIIKQHYIALAKLLKAYHTTSPNRKLLQATLQFCRSLYEAAKNDPDLLFAQPQLYKSQLPYSVNLTFNACVITCLVAARNKCDPAVSIQLMCGAISLFAFKQVEVEKQYQDTPPNTQTSKITLGKKNSAFKQLLGAEKQNIWLCCYAVDPYLSPTYWARKSDLNYVAKLGYLSSRIALLCTYNKYKTHISLAQALKQLSLSVPQTWYALFTPLMHYPSLLPQGSFVKLPDGSVNIVLLHTTHGLVTHPLPTKSVGRPATKEGLIQLTQTDEVVQTYPCQPISRLSQLNNWWGEDLSTWLLSNEDKVKLQAFEILQPMQSVPSGLLVIQDQLSHSEADIGVVVKAIEKESDYARQLQLSASIHNRQRQPVETIRHGLAMLGYERASHTLLQYSLVSRLNQHYFPLQASFLAFSQLYVYITSELALKTKLLTPEVAATTAYFLVSRLFTLPSLKTCVNWEIATYSAQKVETLTKAKGANTLKQGGVLLAQAWQQNKQILQILQEYDAPQNAPKNKYSNSQLCYLLGLSLIKARQFYFPESHICDETKKYIQIALKELGLNNQRLAEIDSATIANTHVFSPLS